MKLTLKQKLAAAESAAEKEKAEALKEALEAKKAREDLLKLRIQGALGENRVCSMIVQEMAPCMLSVYDFFAAQLTWCCGVMVAAIYALFAANFQGWVPTHTSVTVWEHGLLSLFMAFITIEIRKKMLYGELRTWDSRKRVVVGGTGGILMPIIMFIPYWYFCGLPFAASLLGTPTDTIANVMVIIALGSKLPTMITTLVVGIAVYDDLVAMVIMPFLKPFEVLWLSILGLVMFLWFISCSRNWCWLAGLVKRSPRLATFCQNMAVRVAPISRFMDWCGIGWGRLSKWMAMPVMYAFWNLMHHANVHAIVSGVLVAVQLKKEDLNSFENFLKPTMLPVLMGFAAVSCAVVVTWASITDPLANAISNCLMFGKLTGITGALYMGSEVFGWFKMDEEMEWKDIITGSFLSGVALTLSFSLAGVVLSGKPKAVAITGVMRGSIQSGFGAVIWANTFGSRGIITNLRKKHRLNKEDQFYRNFPHRSQKFCDW